MKHQKGRALLPIFTETEICEYINVARFFIAHFVFSYYNVANLLIKFELLAIYKLKVSKN